MPSRSAKSRRDVRKITATGHPNKTNAGGFVTIVGKQGSDGRVLWTATVYGKGEIVDGAGSLSLFEVEDWVRAKYPRATVQLQRPKHTSKKRDPNYTKRSKKTARRRDPKDPWAPKNTVKARMTAQQKKALAAYRFAVQQEDRYLGSVFANYHGQKRYEAMTKAAYDECKRLGLGWEHGL